MTGFFVGGTLLIAATLLWLTRATRGPTRWSLVLGMPLAIVTLYGALGHFEALTPLPEDVDRERVEAMVSRLAARLADQPDDMQGWRKLARSYEQLRRFPDAVRAHERLVALQPEDAGARADLAEALSQTQGGKLAGAPRVQVEAALRIEPTHPKALALAANEAFQRDDPTAAIAYWERMAAAVDTDSEVARALRVNIAKAREPRVPSN